MYNFLEDFDKRMEIVGVVESIVNRKNRNMELERLFNGSAFENLVITVLLYIMEKTLSDDSNCDINHITNFLKDILPELYLSNLDDEQVDLLANYIIKNVLQNEGTPHYFETMDYVNNTKKQIPIRLITDRVVDEKSGYRPIYFLTDQGYDFLFRTKEVEQEIKLTIEELKLKELIKRKNFKRAYDQSQSLIQMVRQKKKEIENFLIRIKENITNVNIDEFERLINSTYELLNEEYELLTEIMDMSHKSEIQIKKDFELSHELDEKLKKAQREIKLINDNIRATLNEQRELILNRQSLSKVYLETIGDSFNYSIENRFDIEDVILKNMERHINLSDRFWQLVNPLFMPNINKNINIRSIYEPQGMLKLEEDKEENFVTKDELTEDNEKEKIIRFNEIYIEIMNYIFVYLQKNNLSCSLEDMMDSLHKDEQLFQRLTEERLFFTTILKLYDMGYVDISRWREGNTAVVMNLSEEFNLEYCLYALMDKYEYLNQINSLEVLKLDNDIVEIEISRRVKDGLCIVEKVEISNFVLRVKANE